MSMFARRNVAAEVAAIDDHNERDQRPRVVPIPGFMQRQDGGAHASSLPAQLDQTEQNVQALRDTLDAYSSGRSNLPVEYKEPPLDDLENIALWVEKLTYRDMKQYAREVLGPEATDEEVRALADKLDAWSSRKLAPKPVEAAQ